MGMSGSVMGIIVLEAALFPNTSLRLVSSTSTTTALLVVTILPLTINSSEFRCIALRSLRACSSRLISCSPSPLRNRVFRTRLTWAAPSPAFSTPSVYAALAVAELPARTQPSSAHACTTQVVHNVLTRVDHEVKGAIHASSNNSLQ